MLTFQQLSMSQPNPSSCSWSLMGRAAQTNTTLLHKASIICVVRSYKAICSQSWQQRYAHSQLLDEAAVRL